MKVQDVMTPSAVCCKAETNVGPAVELLWSHNCSMLLGVDADNRLIGIVTRNVKLPLSSLASD